MIIIIVIIISKLNIAKDQLDGFMMILSVLVAVALIPARTSTRLTNCQECSSNCSLMHQRTMLCKCNNV